MCEINTGRRTDRYFWQAHTHASGASSSLNVKLNLTSSNKCVHGVRLFHHCQPAVATELLRCNLALARLLTADFGVSSLPFIQRCSSRANMPHTLLELIMDWSHGRGWSQWSEQRKHWEAWSCAQRTMKPEASGQSSTPALQCGISNTASITWQNIHSHSSHLNQTLRTPQPTSYPERGQFRVNTREDPVLSKRLRWYGCTGRLR